MVGELLTVVDDVQAEADGWRNLTELKADVARAEDVELRRRLDRLDEDVHLSSADQAGLLGEVVVELVVDDADRRVSSASRAFQKASFS